MGASSDLAERIRTVPRDVGRKLQALTVMAGKRCRGSPNLSSDSGCTWNWMLARSRWESERVKMPSCDGAMVSGAPVLDYQALDQRVLFETQIGPCQRGLEKTARRGPAPAALLVDVKIAHTFIVAGIEIGNSWDAHLFGGVANGIENFPRQPRRL